MKIRDVEVVVLAAPGDYGLTAGGESRGPKYILTAATLHFAAFVPGETFLEFNTSRDPLSRELVTRPFELIGGAVGVPTAPGLGVELNTEALSRLRVA